MKQCDIHGILPVLCVFPPPPPNVFVCVYSGYIKLLLCVSRCQAEFHCVHGRTRQANSADVNVTPGYVLFRQEIRLSLNSLLV